MEVKKATRKLTHKLEHCLLQAHNLGWTNNETYQHYRNNKTNRPHPKLFTIPASDYKQL